MFTVRVGDQQGLSVQQRGGLGEAALRARQPKRLAVAEPADEVNAQPVNRVTFGQGTAFLLAADDDGRSGVLVHLPSSD